LVGKYSQRFPDIAMDSRLCIAMVTGFDFLAHGMSTILDRYLKFYNDPHSFEGAKFHKRINEVKNNNKTLKLIGLDLIFDIPDRMHIGKIKYENNQTLNQQALVLQQPIKFHFGDKKEITGSIDFGFTLLLSLNKTHEKNYWNLELTNKKESILTDFKCDFPKNDCDSVRYFMEKIFNYDVLAFNQEGLKGFHQPTSYRILDGLLRHINEFNRKETETSHFEISAEKENMYSYFNCKADSIENNLARPIGTENYELSAYQNLFD